MRMLEAGRKSASDNSMQGGYDLKGLADSVSDSFCGILGLPSVDDLDPQLLREEPRDKVAAALAEVRSIHGL